jgi:hypothetical protein
MSGLSCREVRIALGVYVVGAIDPAERAMVDTHLSHCQECREELAGLAGLPSLLGRVPLGDAERLAVDGLELRDLEEPSAELLSSLLDKVAARRKVRRWRTLTAAAAAAVIAVGGGLAGGMAVAGALGQHPAGNTQASQGGPPPELVHATNAKTHVSADVSYAPAASGTTIQVRVSGIKDGTTCQFWAKDAAGQVTLAGFWTVTSGNENAWYPASSSMSAASLSSFTVTSGKHLLISIPTS